MARALLDTLKTLNVEVRVESDKLKWKAPQGVMSDNLIAQMKNHKAEILALLSDKQADAYNQGCDSTSSKEEQHQVDSELEDENKELPLNTIILGDCLEKLKTIPDNSIDLLVTDPPYGYKFMGKDWDKAVPSVDIWKECKRVLKPGAFAFIMSAPRQDVLSRMIMNLGESGFIANFTSLYWTYASGFPKARNICKAIDKKLGAERKKLGRNPNSRENCNKSNTIYEGGTVGKTAYHTEPATKEAKKLDGSYAGFQPKPAVEVIIVAMKPCEKKTYTDQGLSNGKGVTWLDDCRTPYKDESGIPTKSNLRPEDFDKVDEKGRRYKLGDNGYKYYFYQGDLIKAKDGRFPANLIISDDVLDDGKEHKSGFAAVGSGGKGESNFISNSKVYSCYGDTVGYSRFFSLDAWAERNLSFLIVPKASKKEKNAGLDNMNEKKVNDGRNKENDTAFQRGATLRKNTHPTVKPIKLMAYLITMGSRENDIVLDPFTGTATTCIAAKMLNRRYIGIEISPEYHEMAVRRIEQADKDNTIKKLIQEAFKGVEDVKSKKNKNRQTKKNIIKDSVCINVPKRRFDDLSG